MTRNRIASHINADTVLQLKEVPEPTDLVKSIPAALKRWEPVCEYLIGIGVMTLADVDLVEMYCINYSHIAECEAHVAKHGQVVIGERGKDVRNPSISILKSLREQQMKILREMALTPFTRAKLNVALGEEDVFADFLLAQRKTKSRNEK